MLVTSSVNLAVAVAFVIMGSFVIYLANSGRMTGGPSLQVAIGNGLTRVFAWVDHVTAGVPEPVLGLAVLALAAVFVVAALWDRQRGPRETEPTDACHHSETTTADLAD